MSILHNAFYKHYNAGKAGVGTFAFCVRRGPRGGRLHGVAFLPDLPDAQPHFVPGPVTLAEMLNATSAIEAMAILRASEEGS